MMQKDDLFFLGTNQALYSITMDEFSDPTKDRDDFDLVKGSNGQVWNLFKDDVTGELLMGHNLGVFTIRNNEAFPVTPSSVNGAWIFREVPGNSDLLMVGTYSGLALLKRDGRGNWAFFRKMPGFLESSRFIEWNDSQAIWVAHGLKGLLKVRFNSDFSRIVDVKSYEDFNGLDEFKDFSLSKIDDRIVFAASHVLYTLNDEEAFVPDELSIFFEDDREYPIRLKQDRFGNIWFFVDNGVGVLRYQEDGSYMRFDNPFVPLKNKLVSGFESLYVLIEETTFFGIEDGFGQYLLGSDINYYQPFNVHIRGIRSQSREDERFFVSSEGLPQSYVPVYSFAENDFEVFFSASWFGSGEVKYSAILEGFEDKWSPWGKVQNRQFTRLPEGKYAFKVKARNVHGVQSKPAAFKFEVLPPWYRTTRAKIIYFALALILVVLIWWITQRIVDKSRQREKLRQKEKYREREDQLRRDALENEKEMIRLRNDKLRNNMKHKEKELANSTMHIIHKNDFLISIKEELLKARKSSDRDMIEKKIASIVRQIDRDIDNEAHWKIFETHLEQVHEDFLKRVSSLHDDLSARELRLAAYLRMNMSSKEIASLMNITPRAVENNRYKLRKKLNLESGDNLVDYIMKVKSLFRVLTALGFQVIEYMNRLIPAITANNFFGFKTSTNDGAIWGIKNGTVIFIGQMYASHTCRLTREHAWDS
jgi:DNA-binding CsgD family transcriptional regulator